MILVPGFSRMNFIPGSSGIETTIKKHGVVFSLLVIFMALFAGTFTKAKPPKKLKNLSDNMYFRIITLLFVAFTATKDLETSLISVFCFLIIMYLLKTPEERKNGII